MPLKTPRSRRRPALPQCGPVGLQQRSVARLVLTRHSRPRGVATPAAGTPCILVGRRRGLAPPSSRRGQPHLRCPRQAPRAPRVGTPDPGKRACPRPCPDSRRHVRPRAPSRPRCPGLFAAAIFPQTSQPCQNIRRRGQRAATPGPGKPACPRPCPDSRRPVRRTAFWRRGAGGPRKARRRLEGARDVSKARCVTREGSCAAEPFTAPWGRGHTDRVARPPRPQPATMWRRCAGRVAPMGGPARLRFDRQAGLHNYKCHRPRIHARRRVLGHPCSLAGASIFARLASNEILSHCRGLFFICEKESRCHTRTSVRGLMAPLHMIICVDPVGIPSFHPVTL